jgi:hypothetical protein
MFPNCHGKIRHSGFLLGLIVLLCAHVARAQIQYGDGQVHTVSTAVGQSIQIFEPGTTLDLLPGGVLEGGSLPIQVEFGAELNVEGGTSNGGYMGTGIWIDESTVNIFSGTVTASGGVSYGIWNSDGTVTISGGNISVGGTTSTDVWNADGTITITGGNFSTAPQSYGIWESGGTISIFGGNFSFPTTSYGIDSLGGTIDIYGNNFDFPLGRIPVGSGTLTGFLANGTPVDVPFNQNGGSIVLIPEPASTAILCASCIALAARRPGVNRLRHIPARAIL